MGSRGVGVRRWRRRRECVHAGIVRQIKAHSPHTEVVLLYMFLRGDLPSERRTGTMAWVNGGVPGDATVYHHQVLIPPGER